MKIGQIKFPKFKKHEILSAELLFYMNFVKGFISKKGYYFRALFNCKKPNSTNYFLSIEQIPLELLALMPSGYSYIFNNGALAKKTKKSNFITEDTNLIIEKEHKPEPLFKYLSEEFFAHIHFVNPEGKKVVFSNEIVSQYVIQLDLGEKKFLIPSNLVASKFYFFSSRVIPHILEDTLYNTYTTLTQENGTYKINLKSGYSDADAPKIVFFSIDKYAKESLKLLLAKYKVDLAKKLNKFPIYARFPFYGSFPCKLYYEKIDKFYYVHDFTITGKVLPYQNLNIEIIRTIKEKGENLIENEKIRNIPLEVFTQDDETYYELSHVRPSKYLKSAEIRISVEKNEVDLKKSYLIEKSENKINVKFRTTTNEVAGLSVEEKATPLSEKEKKTAQLEVKEEIKSQTPEYKRNLDNFRGMIDVLKKEFNFLILWEKELLFPVRKKRINKLSQLEYYDWDKIANGFRPQKKRKFLVLAGKFKDLMNKTVYLIEIDQDGMSYSVSTFVFVDEVNKDRDFKDLIKLFAFFLMKYAEGLTKEKLIKKMLLKGLKTYFKKHPTKLTKLAILSWCRRGVG